MDPPSFPLMRHCKNERIPISPQVIGQLGGVFRGDNVRLHLVLDAVGRIADSHYALVECTPGTDAIIATDAENNSSFFLHWIITVPWTRAVIERRKRARCSITAA